MTVPRVTVKLLLIFVLVYAGVTLWYGRLEERLQGDVTRIQEVVRAKPVEKTIKTLQKAPDYQIIAKRNIFQAKLEVNKDLDKERINTEELEETSLRLALLGTVSGNERDARAIIVDEKQKQQDIYQIGDAIQGAFIKEIERGKVVLEVRGKKEVLLIKDAKGGDPAATSTRASALPSRLETRRQTVRKTPVARPHRRINLRSSAVNPSEPVETEEDFGSEEHMEPQEPLLVEENELFPEEEEISEVEEAIEAHESVE